ncbi:hypothetical protein BV22DRAFT_108318 [Leucogyrophana mollusca]|uniref:Uncharacterized protein n=1 Tax=Leucogyrophana mollusca TaxID=85980 RepID=A0ACB8BX89_9AGAM|nr:hypothetical protein BV22DRAFT_108318 [Leucogyrophana mollusca]
MVPPSGWTISAHGPFPTSSSASSLPPSTQSRPTASSVSIPPSISPSTLTTSSGSSSAFSASSATSSASAPSAPTSPSTAYAADTTSKSRAGAIAGGVVGGVVFFACVAVGLILFRRSRARKRTAPSSEFMNVANHTTTPIFRTDSNAQFTASALESSTQSHNPQAVPLPFMQDSYYTGPVMADMKFPEEFSPSAVRLSRPSMDKSGYPSHYPDAEVYGSYVHPPLHSTSIGSSNEMWSSEMGGHEVGVRPASRSALSNAEEHPLQESPYQPFLQNSYPVLWQMANPQGMALLPQRRSVRRSTEAPSRSTFRPISQSDDFSGT